MDETLRELVSRSLDGDLDDVESARLEERAKTDAELAKEIDAARHLRGAVAALSARMEPPASLDKVMEPLRQSAPATPQRVRSSFRWLGAAAALVLGVTVAVEVARRNPEPTLTRPPHARPRPAEDRREVFELSPLPTARPEKNRPLGAADHLLEEELLQPAAPEPPPLEVMGPLSTDETQAVAIEAPRSTRTKRVSPKGDGAETKVLEPLDSPTVREGFAQTEASAAVTSSASPKTNLARTDEDRQTTAGETSTGKTERPENAGRRQVMEAGIVIRIGGADVWTGRSVTCQEGTWLVRIEVRDNTVVMMEPIKGDAESVDDGGCRPDDLIGSILAGVSDGIHIAEIVVSSDPK